MWRKIVLVPVFLGIAWSPCLQTQAALPSTTNNLVANHLLALSDLNADASKYKLNSVSFKGSVPSGIDFSVSEEDKQKIKDREEFYNYIKQLLDEKNPSLIAHYKVYVAFSFHEQILAEHIKKKTVKRYLADRLYRQLRFKEAAGKLSSDEKSKLEALAPYFTKEDDLKLKLNMYGEGETNNYGFVDVAVDPAHAVEWYRGQAYGIQANEELEGDPEMEDYITPDSRPDWTSYEELLREKRARLPFTFADTKRPLSSLLPDRSVDEFFIRRMPADKKNSQERMLLEIRRLAKPGTKITWVETKQFFNEDKIRDIEHITGATYLGRSKFKDKMPGWKKPQHYQYIFQFM